MSKLIDLTGQRFGDLVVLERDINKPKGRAYWICQCDCGKLLVFLELIYDKAIQKAVVV